MAAILARGVQILIAIGGAYFVAIWFALVVWTFQDIQERSRSVVAQIFSTLVVVLFWVPGVLIYLILRPRDTLDETFQRSLEEEYLLQDLEELSLCPNCQRYVQDDFLFCPHCRVELRAPCAGCAQSIDLRWEICPYCGTEQYPDDQAAGLEAEEMIVPPWEAPVAPSFGRFMQNSRERVSSRWNRLARQETVVLDRDSSVEMYDPESPNAMDGTGLPRANGRPTTRPATQWERLDEAVASAGSDTRELPAGDRHGANGRRGD